MVKSLIALQCKHCNTLMIHFDLFVNIVVLWQHTITSDSFYHGIKIKIKTFIFIRYSLKMKITFMHRAEPLQSKLFHKRTLISSNRIVPANFRIVELWHLNLNHVMFSAMSATTSVQLWKFSSLFTFMNIIYRIHLFASPASCAGAPHIYSFKILSKNK